MPVNTVIRRTISLGRSGAGFAPYAILRLKMGDVKATLRQEGGLVRNQRFNRLLSAVTANVAPFSFGLLGGHPFQEALRASRHAWAPPD